VYERARTLPLVRLVYAAETIPDANSAIARIHDPAFDPALTVILDRDAPCAPGPATTTGAAEIVAHESTRWVVQTNSETPALLVLAENAYPGWEVTVDGSPVEALTAYTSVRAVCVPAGEHTVEWVFTPRVLYWGAAISVLSLLLLAAAVAVLRKTTTDHRPLITGYCPTVKSSPQSDPLA
jgi:hypothetical protein